MYLWNGVVALLCIIVLDEKWSQNDNIIVYRSNFWDNLSSSKRCYRDRPSWISMILTCSPGGWMLFFVPPAAQFTGEGVSRGWDSFSLTKLCCGWAFTMVTVMILVKGSLLWSNKTRNTLFFKPVLSPPADGLISYSAPEGQPMNPPGYPIASFNDSTYDGAHERRQVSHTHHTSVCFFAVSLVCDSQLAHPVGGCSGGWVSWRTAWSAWMTSCRRVSTTCGPATTTWAGGTTRWELRDTWRWSLCLTGGETSPPWRSASLFHLCTVTFDLIPFESYKEMSPLSLCPGSQ